MITRQSPLYASLSECGANYLLRQPHHAVGEIQLRAQVGCCESCLCNASSLKGHENLAQSTLILGSFRSLHMLVIGL